jgi:hypothetical protein
VSQKEDLLSRLSLKPEPFEAAGHSLLLKPLTAGERQAFHAQHKAAAGADVAERAFAFAVCDDAGNRVFTESDIPEIRNLNGAVLEAVAAWFVSRNGLADHEPGKAR